MTTVDERAPGGEPTLDLIARILAAGDERRADRAVRALRTLSRYERRIMREAAIMGFVLGYRDGVVDARMHGVTVVDGRGRFPHDSDITVSVIEHCDSTADLYPYLAAACDGRRRRITRKRLWPGETADESQATARPRADESEGEG